MCSAKTKPQCNNDTLFFLLAGPYTSTNPQWRSITTSESADVRSLLIKHRLRNYVAVFTTLGNYLRLRNYVPNVFTTLRLRNYCSAFTSLLGFAFGLSSPQLRSLAACPQLRSLTACPQLRSLDCVSATACSHRNCGVAFDPLAF